jgi:glycosyltransferase involved in cell wall biosynthesis
MSVIPLGVDIVPAAAHRPRNAGGSPYLLFVGLVKPHKNLTGLLRAFEQIAPAIAHRLIVVGRHSGLRGIDAEALALARRLAPRVELIEGVAAETLAGLMAGADLLIQPSFHEGFGLPPLEAMAAGTPVLAARAGALPEVCGDAALYFDPASAADIARCILQALGDDAMRARLRQAGLARARRFPWNACAGATVAVLLAAARDAAAGASAP